MRGRILAFSAGILLAVTAGVLAQSSGFPSRPRFQSVGVGTTAPATGNVNITGAYQVNGTALLLPKFAASRYSVSAGGCTFSAGTNLNISGCVRNSTGNYTWTISFASTSAPICTAIANQTQTVIAGAVFSGSSGAWTFTVQVHIGGAVSDSAGLISLQCMAI